MLVDSAIKTSLHTFNLKIIASLLLNYLLRFPLLAPKTLLVVDVFPETGIFSTWAAPSPEANFLILAWASVVLAATASFIYLGLDAVFGFRRAQDFATVSSKLGL
jgi:hypothetical protein